MVVVLQLNGTYSSLLLLLLLHVSSVTEVHQISGEVSMTNTAAPASSTLHVRVDKLKSISQVSNSHESTCLITSCLPEQYF